MRPLKDILDDEKRLYDNTQYLTGLIIRTERIIEAVKESDMLPKVKATELMARTDELRSYDIRLEEYNTKLDKVRDELRAYISELFK